MLKKTLLAAVVAAGSLTSLVPIAAHAQYTAIVRVAPPAPVYEVAPAPREGFVWAPGHHEWRNGNYVWIQGHWMPQREGLAYVPPRWIQRSDGEWTMIGGTWERDRYARRDRDNEDRYSYRRDDDGRYSYRRDDPYGDRDGDGVPNWRDRYPDNPHNW